MATKAASKRLSKESQLMERDPPPYCYARPLESDVLTWHFILRGPPDTPYEGGEFWGQLLFPSDYPFKPPGIQISTPSGRFHPNQKICTSMSDFHPGSWNPAWSVANILVGLHSFMNSEEMTTGSMSATPAYRQQMASRSHQWNASQARFIKVFPEFAEDKVNAKDLPNMGQKKGDSGLRNNSSSSSNVGKSCQEGTALRGAISESSARSATGTSIQPARSAADAAPLHSPISSDSIAQDQSARPSAGEASQEERRTGALPTWSKLAALVFAILASLFVGRIFHHVASASGSAARTT